MSSHARHYLIALVLFALTLATFWPARSCRFVVYDDDLYVTANPAVRDGLTVAGTAWAFTTDRTGNYHPLTWLSLMADAQFFGTAPRTFHTTNIVIHALNAAFLFLLLAAMTGATWRSALIAALFAVHPLRVESVAWISERKDVLSACLGLLALLAYVRYTRRPAMLRYTLVLALFTASLLAKPMLVTFPFLLLLLDYWPLRRWQHSPQEPTASSQDLRAGLCESGCRAAANSAPLPPGEGGLYSGRVRAWEYENKPCNESESSCPPMAIPASTTTPLRLLLDKLPFLLLAALFSIVAFLTQRRSGAIVTLDFDSPTHRAATALLAYARYLANFFWPAALTMPYPLHPHWPISWIAISGTLLTTITVLTIAQRHRRPHLLVGWLWFLGTLVPVIGLVQIGPQALADRYSYFPTIGLLIMIAWSLPVGLRRLLPPPIPGVRGRSACIPARRDRWGVNSENQGTDFNPSRPSLALGQPICAAAFATVLLACILLTRRQIHYWRDSETLLNRSLAVAASDPLAYSHVGSVYMALHEYDRAASAFHQATTCDRNDPQLHVNLGNALAADAQVRPAYAEFQIALALDPKNLPALKSIARLLAAYNRRAQATAYYQKVLRLDPHDPSAQQQLAAWSHQNYPAATPSNASQKVTGAFPQ